MSHAIVNFPETNEVEVVPTRWLENGEGALKCWWPPFKSYSKTKSAVKNQLSVDVECWGLFNARILGSYDSYNASLMKLPRAQETSNLESEEEITTRPVRKRTSTMIQNPNSSDLESEEETDLVNGKRLKRSKVGNQHQIHARSMPLPVPPEINRPISFELAEGSGVYSNFQHVSASTVPGSESTGGCSSSQIARDNLPEHYTTTTSELEMAEAINAVGNGLQPLSNYSPMNTESPIARGDGRFNRFQQYVMNSMANIDLKLKAHNELLTKLSNFLLKTGPLTELGDMNFEFPLTNMGQVIELEKKLEDKKTLAKLVDYLSMIGGADYKECVANIMKKILSDELASRFCWEGIRKLNPKEPFKKLKLKDAIFKAVLSTPTGKCANATEHDIKCKAASWLQHAPDRVKSKQGKSQTEDEGDDE